MYDSTRTGERKKRRVGAVGLLAAGAIIGGVIASTLSASAASSTPAASGSTASTSSGNDATRRGPGGAQPVRPDEKRVSSGTAATLRAAALKAVKAGGSFVTVKFDKNLKVMKVESGMGAGDPAPANRGTPGAGA